MKVRKSSLKDKIGSIKFETEAQQQHSGDHPYMVCCMKEQEWIRPKARRGAPHRSMNDEPT